MARVLFLDDEEPLVFLATRMLVLLKHEPRGFTAAAAALSAFRAAPQEFDLVLTDLSMPAMSGIDFATQILAADPQAIVGVVTGHADESETQAAQAAGIRAVLAKPATLEQMQQIVTQLLEVEG